MAFWIKASGEVVTVTPENGRTFSLSELQGYVGGSIELTRTHSGRLMFIDEEGRLKGKPLNATATALYEGPDDIVGDALTCEQSELKEAED